MDDDGGRLALILERARSKGLAASGTGTVSKQVPGLDAVASERFAISVALHDGRVLSSGDASVAFSLQSISKLFSLCALLQVEPGAWEHVGWEPSDAAYRSISELEHRGGRPRNPFVNAGALVATDRLQSRTGDAVQATLELIRAQCGSRRVRSIPAVARAEQESDHINAAIAHVLAEHGRLANPIPVVLRQYTRQCAIAASTEEVARAALFLAGPGRTDAPLDAESRRRVNAVMLTAGTYDAAGDIAYRVGIPVKSGIGGGIVGVMPGVGSVCVWSPPLDSRGNSVGGIAALEELSRLGGWSLF